MQGERERDGGSCAYARLRNTATLKRHEVGAGETHLWRTPLVFWHGFFREGCLGAAVLLATKLIPALKAVGTHR